jgi:hypothetical protein
MTPELLIFLHIPKTAGATLQGVLHREYQGSPMLDLSTPESERELEAMSTAERSSIRLVTGHFYFGVHSLFPQESAYLTILRDPLERVVSHYYYARSHPEHDLHDRIVEEELSLHDYVTGDLSNELENGQVKQLSQRAAAGAECNRDCLEEAKTNLKEHFPVVGITEQFDLSLILFQRQFGWTTPRYVSRNVGDPSEREPLDERTKAVILERNRLDQQLYEFVARRFDDERTAAGPELEEDARTLARANANSRNGSARFGVIARQARRLNTAFRR